jgi:hypothetical protein
MTGDRRDRDRRDRGDAFGDASSIAGRILAGEDWTGDLARRLDDVHEVVGGRVNADEERLEKGLAQLVLTIVELLRQLMERQAVRRVEGGHLSEDEVERLGRALMLLDQRMTELREVFGLREEDLNLDLGPLGRLL